jgi:hypothetical protein
MSKDQPNHAPKEQPVAESQRTLVRVIADGSAKTFVYKENTHVRSSPVGSETTGQTWMRRG